jgi:hypothetical protein
MILLRLKVSNLLGEGNKPVQVTTAMLDVIASPGAVSYLYWRKTERPELRRVPRPIRQRGSLLRSC